jgi:hypothetical protein
MSACLQELDCHNTLDLSFRDQTARLSRGGRLLRACILNPCTNDPDVSMGVLAGRTVLGSIRVYSNALENQYLSFYPPNALIQLVSANRGAVYKVV